MIEDVKLSIRHRAQRNYERQFDERNRVQTDGIVTLGRLTIESPNKNMGSEYVPSPGRLIEHAFAHLPPDLREYTFIDVGSGKGRILLHAALHDFKQIIGVEFAAELHAISKQNIAAFSAANKHHPPISGVLGDAIDFIIPDGKCVFFFYNPFGRPVMERVLENIAASYRQEPRKIYFMFLSLKHERGNDADANRELLERQAYLRPLKSWNANRGAWIKLQFGSHKLTMYETADAGNPIKRRQRGANGAAASHLE